MRRWLFLFISIIFLAVTLFLRRNIESIQFVISPKADDVLYATTFNDGKYADDWSIQDRRGATIEATDDLLRLSFAEFTQQRELLRASPPFLFSDFDLRVDAAAVGGELNNSYGVIFRQIDDGTFYAFYISSDGWYSIWRVTGSSPFALSAWIPSDAINQGTNGEQNQIRVLAEADTFQFFVNDQLLMLCIPDNPGGESTYTSECVDGTMQDTLTDDTIPVGRVGVIIETIVPGEISVEFDNFVLLPPE